MASDQIEIRHGWWKVRGDLSGFYHATPVESGSENTDDTWFFESWGAKPPEFGWLIPTCDQNTEAGAKALGELHLEVDDEITGSLSHSYARTD